MTKLDDFIDSKLKELESMRNDFKTNVYDIGQLMLLREMKKLDK